MGESSFELVLNGNILRGVRLWNFIGVILYLKTP